MKRKGLMCFLFLSIILLIKPQFSLAQAKYSIKQMTPEVTQSLDNRRDRFEKLRGLKKSAIVGENNSGYVVLLKEDGQAKEIVAAENSDRKIIYETIVQQNDLKDALSTIEKVFAQVQRDKSEGGDQIQQEDGSWSVKP